MKNNNNKKDQKNKKHDDKKNKNIVGRFEINSYSSFLELLHKNIEITDDDYQNMYSQLSTTKSFAKHINHKDIKNMALDTDDKIKKIKDYYDENFRRQKKIISKYSIENKSHVAISKNSDGKIQLIKKSSSANQYRNVFNQLRRNFKKLGIKNKYIIASATLFFLNNDFELGKYKNFCFAFGKSIDIKSDNIDDKKLKKLFVGQKYFLCSDVFAKYYMDTTTKTKEIKKSSSLLDIRNKTYMPKSEYTDDKIQIENIPTTKEIIKHEKISFEIINYDDIKPKTKIE